MFSIFKAFTAAGTRDVLQKRVDSLLKEHANESARQGIVFSELAAFHYKVNKIEVLDRQTFLLETAPFLMMDLSTFKYVVPEYLMFKMPNQLARQAVDLAALKKYFNDALLFPSGEDSEALDAAREILAPLIGKHFAVFALRHYVPWIDWLDREAIEQTFGPMPLSP